MTARTWLSHGAIAIAACGLVIFGWGRAHAQTSGQTNVALFAVAQAKPEGGAVPAAPKLPAALPPDVAFARFIALIRGHLLTGDELASQREWNGALPHFNFPTEEIYGVIREDLRSYKTPQFDDALKALARAVKADNAKQYSNARKRVEDALVAADAGLKAKQPNWQRFVMQVAIEVLKTSADEYDDAVAKGRIMRPIGYQTARGFILQADRMIESVAGELGANNAAALADMRAELAQLKQAFASVTAPKQAVMDYAELVAIVSRIELAAGKLNISGGRWPNTPTTPS
jgi:hypothetical protein